MAPVPIVKPASKLPYSQGNGTKSLTGVFVMIRDQFTISTWLCIGATFQLIASLFVYRSLFLYAPALLLSFRLIDTMLQTLGLTRNKRMDGVVLNKFSAQIPNREGVFSDKAADEPVTFFVIGAESNHPLGMFAPGFKELSDRFNAMINSLDENPAEYGYLGSTSWINASHRATSNGVMTTMYFRNNEGLHAFAHSTIHREAWDWWNQHYKKHTHIGIMHEAYQVPKGNWENIFVNYHPVGITATKYGVKASEKSIGVQDSWLSPIFDANRGKLRTNQGRMGRTQGDDNEKYGPDPYETV